MTTEQVIEFLVDKDKLTTNHLYFIYSLDELNVKNYFNSFYFEVVGRQTVQCWFNSKTTVVQLYIDLVDYRQIMIHHFMTSKNYYACDYDNSIIKTIDVVIEDIKKYYATKNS